LKKTPCFGGGGTNVKEYPTGEYKVFEFGLTSEKPDGFSLSSRSDDLSDVGENAVLIMKEGVKNLLFFRAGFYFPRQMFSSDNFRFILFAFCRPVIFLFFSTLTGR